LAVNDVLCNQCMTFSADDRTTRCLGPPVVTAPRPIGSSEKPMQ